MLSDNVPTAFLIEKSDFLPAFGQSRLNFNVHLMHYLREDSVTSSKDFCTASSKIFMK